MIAAVAISFPLMYRAARGAFEQVDVTLIYAARTLGFSESRIFWKVSSGRRRCRGVLAARSLPLREDWASSVRPRCWRAISPERRRHWPLAIYSQVAAWKNVDGNNQYVWIIVVISFLVVVLMNVLSRRDMRGRSNHKKKDNSVEAGGQDVKGFGGTVCGQGSGCTEGSAR